MGRVRKDTAFFLGGAGLLGSLEALGALGERLRFFGCGDSGGGQGAGVMALNGRRSLTLTEWQSLPLVAE